MKKSRSQNHRSKRCGCALSPKARRQRKVRDVAKWKPLPSGKVRRSQQTQTGAAGRNSAAAPDDRRHSSNPTLWGRRSRTAVAAKGINHHRMGEKPVRQEARIDTSAARGHFCDQHPVKRLLGHHVIAGPWTCHWRRFNTQLIREVLQALFPIGQVQRLRTTAPLLDPLPARRGIARGREQPNPLGGLTQAGIHLPHPAQFPR